MKNQEQRYNKLRRQKINLMLNEEERKLITEKAIQYGFGDCLAEYIRAAAIYENIYIEDLEGKSEICDIVSSFIDMLKQILNEQKKLLKNVLLSKDDIATISNQNKTIIEKIDLLSKLVVANLSVNAEKKIQQREDAIKRHKVDGIFFNRIIKKDPNILVVRPSNLHLPNQKTTYIVYLKKYINEFDLSSIDMQEFVFLVNNLRDMAMRKNLLLCFNRENNYLKVGIVMDFEDYESAENFMIESKENDFVMLDKDRKSVGEVNANYK